MSFLVPQQTEIRQILVLKIIRARYDSHVVNLLQSLKNLFPEAKLATIVSPPSLKWLSRNYQIIDELLVFDRRGRDRGLKGMIEFIKTLRQQKFDLAAIFYDNRSGLGHLKLEVLAGLVGARGIITCNVDGRISKLSKAFLILRILAESLLVLSLSILAALASFLIFNILCLVDLFSALTIRQIKH